MVALINNYLHLSKEIFENCLDENENIYYKFYPENGKLLIAPVSAEFFSKIHEDSTATFLKLKNSEGVRNFQITPVLLDFDISMENRDLPFSFNPKTKILTVSLAL